MTARKRALRLRRAIWSRSRMAPYVFIAVWILVGVGLVLVALRGGPRRTRDTLQTQSRHGRRVANVVFAVAFIGLGIAVPAAFMIGNHANASQHYKGVKLNTQDRKGRDVFMISCASCHTLKAAHAYGTVGPNLDQLKPPKALILDALAHGRQRGNGTMPANIVIGGDAQAVADFVAKVAGR
jgi:cytochrome c5